MQAESLKDSIVTLLGDNAAGRFVVIGYKTQAQSSEKTKDDYRSVQVFLFNGGFPKNKRNGPYSHDLKIRVDITASKASKADLLILEDTGSSEAEKITAISEMQNSSHLAESSALECLGFVFDILADSRQDDFGFGDTVSNKKIIDWTNNGPLEYGKLTVNTISLNISVSVEESVVGETPVAAEDPIFDTTVDVYDNDEENNDQVFDIANNGEPVITNIDTDDIITISQTNIVLTGSILGVIEGKLYLSNNSDFDLASITVEQSIDSWTDTSIQFDVIPGTLID